MVFVAKKWWQWKMTSKLSNFFLTQFSLFVLLSFPLPLYFFSVFICYLFMFLLFQQITEQSTFYLWPFKLSVFLSLFMSLSLCVFVSLCLCLFMSLCLCLFMPLSLLSSLSVHFTLCWNLEIIFYIFEILVLTTNLQEPPQAFTHKSCTMKAIEAKAGSRYECAALTFDHNLILIEGQFRKSFEFEAS